MTTKTKKTEKKITKKVTKKIIKKSAATKPVKAVKVVKAAKIADPILELAQTAFEAMVETKAEEPLILDIRELASFTDYLLIASGTNPRQVVAMADRIVDAIKKKLNRRPMNREGMETAMWVVLDYGDIVCHLFTEETRDFYSLENLWHDAKLVKVGKTKK